MSKDPELEVLAFAREHQRAHIVSDGTHTRSYEEGGCTVHDTLTKAIAYLEAKGYKIQIDEWNR